MLYYLDYQFKSNLYINGFEVDFLIGKNLILEYNGFHHYCTNYEQLKPNFKHSWKKHIFQKRGFVYCDISFEEWDRLENNIEQRNFLIHKIETTLASQLPFATN